MSLNIAICVHQDKSLSKYKRLYTIIHVDRKDSLIRIQIAKISYTFMCGPRLLQVEGSFVVRLFIRSPLYSFIIIITFCSSMNIPIIDYKMATHMSASIRLGHSDVRFSTSRPLRRPLQYVQATQTSLRLTPTIHCVFSHSMGRPLVAGSVYYITVPLLPGESQRKSEVKCS